MIVCETTKNTKSVIYDYITTTNQGVFYSSVLSLECIYAHRRVY